MQDVVVGMLLGAASGLAVAVAGYFKNMKMTKEVFDVKKFGLTLVVGLASGAVISMGVGNEDMLLQFIAVAGLGSVA